MIFACLQTNGEGKEKLCQPLASIKSYFPYYPSFKLGEWVAQILVICMFLDHKLWRAQIGIICWYKLFLEWLGVCFEIMLDSNCPCIFAINLISSFLQLTTWWPVGWRMQGTGEILAKCLWKGQRSRGDWWYSDLITWWYDYIGIDTIIW